MYTGSLGSKALEGAHPTVSARLQGAGKKAVQEWRFLSILVVLISLAVMLGDVDRTLQAGLRRKPKEESVTYADIKASMKAHPSFMTFYTGSGGSKNLMLELPLRLIKAVEGKPLQSFVVSATFARGMQDDGSSIYLLHGPAEVTDHNVFFFNLTADHLGVDVIRQQFSIVTSNPQDEQAVRVGAIHSLAVTLPIVAINRAGENTTVVVDGEELVKRGFLVTDVKDAASARLDLSGCTHFPRNLAITVEYMIPKSDADPTLVPVPLLFSIALLPDDPIMPRALDTRVGYFYHAYTDLGDHRSNPNMSQFFRHESEKVDSRVRVINRKRLQSGPNFKPLTYYIDPTVPEKWRPAFRAGVEAWRPAFAAAGFGDQAIRAVLPGDPDWPADYAHGDVRYSTINWVVSVGKTFALGPTVVDPRSGEIMDSDILVTHGWVKHYLAMFEAEDVSISSAATPIRQGGAGHEHSHDHDHDHDDGPLAGRFPRRRASSLAHHQWGSCQEERLRHDVSPFLAKLALGGGDPMYTLGDDLIMAGLKDVVMHEVGHTLGLRHNFKASSGTTWEQTQNYTYTQANGLAVSVMDYLPLNVVSGRDASKKVDYFSPVIGSYDVMAIKYGYMEVPGEQPGMPHPKLTALPEEANLPFATDEDDSSAMGLDPSVSSFDFTSDPARYFLDRLDLVAELRPHLLERTVAVGDEYLRFTSVDALLRNTTFHAAKFLVKYIGGYSVEHLHRSAADTAAHPRPPIEVVTGTEQARALGGILRVLTDESGQLFMKPEQAAYAVTKAGDCQGFWEHCLARMPVDMLKQVDDGRVEVLHVLLNETRLSRLRTADWMLRGQGKDSLTVPDLLRNVTAALWGKKGAADPRLENPRTWSMALAHVDRLLELAKSATLPPEIVVAVGGELFRIQESVSAALSSSSGTVHADSPSYPLMRMVEARLAALGRKASTPPSNATAKAGGGRR